MTNKAEDVDAISETNFDGVRKALGGGTLVILTIALACRTGDMVVTFPNGGQGVATLIGLLALVCIAMAFLAFPAPLKVAREKISNIDPRSKQPEVQRYTTDNASPDAKIGKADSDQPAKSGEVQSIAATSFAPKPDSESDQGDKRRTDGSSRAPRIPRGAQTPAKKP